MNEKAPSGIPQVQGKKLCTENTTAAAKANRK